MNRLLAITAALFAVLLLPAIALGHTGSIHATQSCNAGNIVTAHLDANVAAQATWTVRIRGTVVDSGTGPGPANLGPYDAGYGAGIATLTIVFQQETNAYSATLKETEECVIPSPTPEVTPTPSPTPTPTVTPTPPGPSATPTSTPTNTPPSTQPFTPVPSTGIPSPRPTLPPTSTEDEPSSLTYVGVVGILAALALVIGSLGIALRRFRG